MVKKHLIVLTSLLFMSACALWPDYHKPAITVNQQWPNRDAIEINDSVDLPDMLWWKQLHSPELNALIEEGLKNNNKLHIVMAKIDYAKAKLQQVKLSWLPSMSLLAGFSELPVFGNPGAFYIVAPNYVLNIFQQYKKQTNAEAILKASEYAKDAARLTVISDISLSYFTVLAEHEAQLLYKKLITDYQQYLKLVERNYQTGLSAQDKIFQLQSLIKQLQSQETISHHNTIVANNTLHFLLNKNPSKLTVKQSFRTIHITKLSPINLPTTVLHNRPDVRKAESLLQAANADIGASIADLLPSISLGAYLGQGSYISGGINASQAYVETPLIDLPILSKIHSSQALYNLVYSNYTDTVRRALRDVDTHLSAYSAYTTQLSNNRHALMDDEKRCNLIKQRFAHGIDSQIDVIQCIIHTDRLRLIINQNKLARLLVIVALYQDLAGGYRGA